MGVRTCERMLCAGFGACVRRHFIQLHRLTRACEQQAQRKAQMIMFFSAALFYTRSVFVSCPGLSLCLLSLSLSLSHSLSLSLDFSVLHQVRVFTP